MVVPLIAEGGGHLDFPLVAGLPPLLSFSRASAATYVRGGQVLTAPAGSPRFETDAAGTALGLLLEPAATQYCTTAAFPQSVSLPTGTFVLWCAGPGSASITAGTAVGTGWGTATAASPVVVTITTAGTATLTTSGGPTQVQLEGGNTPTSYISPGSTTVTRAADYLWLDLTKLPRFMTAAGHTMAIGLSIPGLPAEGVHKGLASSVAGAFSNSLYVSVDTSGKIFATRAGGGVPAGGPISLGVLPINSLRRIAISSDGAGISAVATGHSLGRSASAAYVAPDQISPWGSWAKPPDTNLAAHVLRFRAYPRRVSDIELARLVA